MGGYGSGRSGGRLTVESGLTLDLQRLFKSGWLKADARILGLLQRTVVSTGKEAASMGFESDLGQETGYVQLRWTSTNQRSGEKSQRENRITLTTSSQPFGGRRWFFVCPHTGEKAEKLHLPSGADTFASRKAYRLGYRSQRESPRDRSLSRAFALREKIGGKGGICTSIEKPKGMHARTFKRAMEKVYAAEEIVDAHADLLLAAETLKAALIEQPNARARHCCRLEAIARYPSVCRMHGAGGDAPRGNQNALKHGAHSAASLALIADSRGSRPPIPG
jgi:hypothetical protein